MSDMLFERLHRLRHRVVQLLSLYGASWVVSVVLTAVVFVGCLDWLIHLDDPGVRLILGLGILVGGSLTAWRFLIAPLRRTFSDVDLALRIERRFPGFQDSLASSVQFLETSSNPSLGSPALQRKVIADTLRRVEGIDLGDVLDTRQVFRAAVVAFTVCLVTLTLVASNVSLAGTALHRLLFPFSASGWPRNTELRLMSSRFEPIDRNPVEPLRIAQGTTLEMFVENARGPLPDDLRMETGPAGEPPLVEKLRRTTLRDDRGRSRDVGAVTIPAIRGAMRFRVLGGDDDQMRFLRLEVVPPPLTEEFQATLTPPKYSRKRPETLPPGVGHVQGLVGTSVALTATVNKPLKSARLRVKDKPPVDIPLSEDGLSFRTAFTIPEAGVYSYWFELQDQQGFENPEAPRYEVRGMADLVPDVTIELPPTDVTVTADAEIPFRLVARDDLGLKGVKLVIRNGDRGDALTKSVTLFDGAERPQQHVATHVVSVQEFDPQPGARILVHGEAGDDFDLGPEHVGRSIARVLTVVSSEGKTAELAARQGALVDELERIVQWQTRSGEQVSQLLLQLEKAQKLQSGDIDLLKRIELDQKQLASRIGGPIDSVESRSRELIQELRQNGINDEGMLSRLSHLADDLAQLKRENLPVIEQELTRARKSAVTGEPASRPESAAPKPDATKSDAKSEPGKSDPDPATPKKARPPAGEKQPGEEGATPPGSDEKPASKPDSPKDFKPPSAPAEEQTDALTKVGEQQEQVLQSLGDQLRKLAEWRSRRDVSGELNELISGQKQINEETTKLGPRTLGKPADQLAPQDQADLARLAERQNRHADRAAQLRAKLGEMARDFEETNPDAAETLREIQDELRREATAESMREVADQLEKNNIGQAATSQKEILEELEELQKSLRESRTSDTEEMVKKLKREEAEMKQLQHRQESLQKKAEDAEQIPTVGERAAEIERLRKEQRKLQDDVADSLRRLRRLPSKPAADAARRAAERMEKADAALEKNDPDAAQEEMQEALDDLKQAQRELAKERQEAEEKLARELLAKIADEIRAMAPRQQTVIDETQRLDGEFRTRGNWTRGQLKTLVGLAEVQNGLKDETDRLAEKIKAAEVFALALRGASRSMQTAATRLSERKTDAVTLGMETAALKRFLDLVESLKEEPKKDDENGAGQGGDQEPAGQKNEGPPTDGIPQLAQLKMLKSLQEDLLQRTVALDALREENGGLTPEQTAELEAIALEQGQLADLARNLTRQAAAVASPEEDAPKKPASKKPAADEKPGDEKDPKESGAKPDADS